VTDPVITTLQGRVAAVESEIDKLRTESSGARGALQGAWGNPGLIERVRTVETSQSEIKSMLTAVKQQQQVDQTRQADRAEQRDREQQRRDKRMGQYIGGLVSLVVAVLGGVILNIFASGMAHP
jgi:transaldolase